MKKTGFDGSFCNLYNRVEEFDVVGFGKHQRDTGFQPVLEMWESVSVDFDQFSRS